MFNGNYWKELFRSKLPSIRKIRIILFPTPLWPRKILLVLDSLIHSISKRHSGLTRKHWLITWGHVSRIACDLSLFITKLIFPDFKDSSRCELSSTGRRISFDSKHLLTKYPTEQRKKVCAKIREKNNCLYSDMVLLKTLQKSSLLSISQIYLFLPYTDANQIVPWRLSNRRQSSAVSRKCLTTW